MSSSKSELFSEFNEIDFQEYLEKISTDLKGKNPEETLNWESDSGINISALNDPKTTSEIFNELPNDWEIIDWNQSDLTYASPLDHLTSTGNWSVSKSELFTSLENNLNDPSNDLQVSGSILHNAGANVVQELAFSLAQGNEYLNCLSGNKKMLNKIQERFRFNFGISSLYFIEIAKLRAFRVLWNTILDQYTDGPFEPTSIHCETSLWDRVLIDQDTNMIRSTTQALAAIVGGCNSLTIVPYSLKHDVVETAKRIARNLQLICKEEAHLDKFNDPSFGSMYIENITKEIGNAAWKLFQEIEARGGYIKSLEDNFIQDQISSVARVRIEKVKSGKTAVIGFNKYRDENNITTEQVIKYSKSNGSTLTPIVPVNRYEFNEVAKVDE